MTQILKSSLKQVDIIKMLASFGFRGLDLISSKELAYTYKFDSVNIKDLTSALGNPTLASEGKVLVFEIPMTGKVGVSKDNSVVRFLDKTSKSNTARDSHITKVVVPTSISTAFLRASGNPSKRVAFCADLWKFLNDLKFEGQMTAPKFLVDDKAPSSSTKDARGVYTPGSGFKPGTLFMASFMFNAREHFFVEVFLHEMAHQATWVLSHCTDFSLNGHGPVWQGWMKKIGLDPRRYDPTDDIEYKSHSEAEESEMSLTRSFGPRASASDLSKLVPLNRVPAPSEVCRLVYKGRIIKGSLKGKAFEGSNEVSLKFTFRQVFKTQASLKSTVFYE